ncbi:hypothetical protein [Algoriphagus sp. NG3]|uniref:hypothetical protein n=1 Tax=Algoriphagus sp. NG3 TaxID=3097546 RepID=UPI002A802F24|nr:hypothetical protein [Algoriphagus sp. NG3]WPR77391.1 hypothetical protein SLW71_08530 [Algoriphagus sp. NG3]
MVNPIGLGAVFSGKEGAIRGMAPRSKQVYEKYETQASISLLGRIAKGKFFFRPFGLAPSPEAGREKTKTPAYPQPGSFTKTVHWTVSLRLALLQAGPSLNSFTERIFNGLSYRTYQPLAPLPRSPPRLKNRDICYLTNNPVFTGYHYS